MSLDLNELFVLHDEAGNKFIIPLGELEAFINYRIAGKNIVFLHAEVPPAYEGKGIAAKMTREALEYARNHGLRVISLCSYISRFIARHPEFHELQQVMD